MSKKADKATRVPVLRPAIHPAMPTSDNEVALAIVIRIMNATMMASTHIM